MKSNKKLLEIWDNKNKSDKEHFDYEDLPHEDKMRIWDLLIKRTKKIVSIELEEGVISIDGNEEEELLRDILMSVY